MTCSPTKLPSSLEATPKRPLYPQCRILTFLGHSFWDRAGDGSPDKVLLAASQAVFLGDGAGRRGSGVEASGFKTPFRIAWHLRDKEALVLQGTARRNRPK